MSSTLSKLIKICNFIRENSLEGKLLSEEQLRSLIGKFAGFSDATFHRYKKLLEQFKIIQRTNKNQYIIISSVPEDPLQEIINNSNKENNGGDN